MPFEVTLLNHPIVSPPAARAHAMKNCVAVIVAIGSLLERELACGGAHERCHRLVSAAARLQELLREALSENTPERVSPPPLPCLVHTVVDSVLARMTDRAEGAGVALSVHCEGGALVCNGVALTEALFNIVANAVDATPRGGAVALETRTTEDGDQQWVVRDNGCGMPDDQARDLGKPFASRKCGGTGIGLAAALEVVASHGGLVRVESSIGNGTTVTVWLLANPEPQRRS
jgi:signal transduction histidine kinase